jgi:putative nucleotidyltransferase with HDIG domain
MDISETIINDCEIPAMPGVALKILSIVNDPNSDIADLENTILADQALSARVLRIANSVFYGVGRNVDTISDAIRIMGLDTIKNLSLAVATKNAYKKFGLLEQKLWEHSIGVSIAAGLLAREVRFPDVEEAFMAGLLHDIGKVVMDNCHPERFLILTEAVYNERVNFLQKEKEIFGFGHAEVGGLFAKKWKFPESLCEVISKHHSCNPDDGTFEGDDYKRSMFYIVALADAICVRLGVGYRGPMKDIVMLDIKWRDLLGISEERLSELTETFKQSYVTEKMLYQF